MPRPRTKRLTETLHALVLACRELFEHSMTVVPILEQHNELKAAQGLRTRVSALEHAMREHDQAIVEATQQPKKPQ